MIKATWQYLRDETRPRFKRIVCGSEFWIALVIGVSSGICGSLILTAETKVGDIITGLLTYSAIALGFCLAGLTLALTLPDRQFVKQLATCKPGSKGNAYADLLFVFSWTAICHWGAVVVFIGILIFSGSQEVILSASSSTWRRFVVGATAFITVYGVLQFLITLITLSQVGRTYITALNQDQRS